MSRTIRALSCAVLALAGCASTPPDGAVDAARTAVTANPAIAERLGADYRATYVPDRSVESASLGTRVLFDVLGEKGSGEAEVQVGRRGEGPWVADHVNLTYFDRWTLRQKDGAWQPDPR